MKSTFTLWMILLFLVYVAPAQEVRVWPKASITLEPGASLDISAGNLVLKSDASGDASLIDYGNITYSGGGEAKVERYLTEGNWHLISSPVTNAQSGLFLGDYLQTHAEASNGWTDIASETYNLELMQGYALWSVEASPTTEVFTGTTNTGNFNKAFTQNGDGWNLVGNPFPSALDWDAVTIPPQLNGAIWLFDPTIGANGDYLYYINGGGAANTTTQYIPSSQAFFVRATGGSGTLTLDNSDRVHSDQPFYKSTDKDLLVLKVSGNNVTTQSAIRFNENATQHADRLFDVYKIISDKPDVPNLFTRIGNETMAINTLPSIEGNEIVPVWFRAGMNGQYTISATQMETFDGQVPVFIEDIETGTIQNLRTDPKFVFDYKSGKDHGFLIYFTDPGSGNQMHSNVSVFANNGMLNINFPVTEMANVDFSAQIMVFEVTGRLVYQNSTREINNQIQLNGSNTIYLVSIIKDNEVENTKVFLK